MGKKNQRHIFSWSFVLVANIISLSEGSAGENLASMMVGLAENWKEMSNSKGP